MPLFMMCVSHVEAPPLAGYSKEVSALLIFLTLALLRQAEGGKNRRYSRNYGKRDVFGIEGRHLLENGAIVLMLTITNREL